MKVLIACSGLGHVARGFELASQELWEALHGRLDATLVRGGGPWVHGVGIRLPCLQRFGKAAKLAGLYGPKAYLVEQRSFAPLVYALARGGGFDVVHLHDPGLMNTLWHARRLLGGRFAIAFTNGGPLSPEHLQRPDLVQCVTPVDAERFREARFPDWRIATVPHAATRPPPPAGRTFADGPPRRLIGIGTLNDGHKGFATAIRAAAALDGATLRLLGQRDEETLAIEALGASLMGARFSTATVPPERVAGELAQADAFVLPTHVEGFCIAALEAMAAGVPCVVSDIPVLRWLLGDAGVFVPVDEPERWAAAMRSLSATKRREMSEAGLRRAAEFRWDRVADAYVEMYDRAVSARSRSAAG
jgi:glycosyltransferase involved in cell wall biosynthesis